MANWERYATARNQATWKVRQAKRSQEERVTSNLKRNPKCFWNIMRQKTKVKDSRGDLVTNDSKILTLAQHKADCLNDFFLQFLQKKTPLVFHF